MPLPVAMDLPFHVGADGGVAVTRDTGRQIRQRIVTVMGTNPTERVMMPNFGVPTNSFLFEPGEFEVSADLTDLTRRQMAMWEPGVIVNNIIPDRNDDMSMVVLDIDYILTDSPDSPDNLSRSVHSASIDRNGRLREVLRG